MLMSCGRSGLGEYLEDSMELTKEIIDDGHNYLQLWTSKFNSLFVNEVHDIPNTETYYLKTCLAAQIKFTHAIKYDSHVVFLRNLALLLKVTINAILLFNCY